MIFNLNMKQQPSQYSPLVLAHIGDAVYEVYVRTRVLSENPDLPAHKLHVNTIKIVKAHAQSNSINALIDILEEDETSIYKRGRNAKSGTVPKNADLNDYKRATGLESLVGYLYLLDKHKRLEEIMSIAYENAQVELIK